MIEEIINKSSSPYSRTINYKIDDIIVGYLDYSLIYDRMEIDKIKVEEEYQGKGIGTKLMSYLVSIAIENKVDNITLEVRKSNDKAIHLYKKFGFHEVAVRKYYYGDEDAILMEKQVM